MDEETRKQRALELGEAKLESEELTKCFTELQTKLNSYAKALVAATQRDILTFYDEKLDYDGDPLKDWAELKAMRERLSQLNKILL